MFEAQVAYYLNRYLGEYVEGIDQKSLAISIYAGNVSLQHLRLKSSALAALELPVSVKAGLIDKLTLKVPWNALGRTPVVVSIDKVYLLAEPRLSSPSSQAATDEASTNSQGVGPENVSQETLLLAEKSGVHGSFDDDTGGSLYNSNDSMDDSMLLKEIEDAFQRSKLERVDKYERRWIDELNELEVRQGKRLTEGEASAAGNKEGGFLRGLIDIIVGNLQFKIENVHVRYEDSQTYPSHPFACGFVLKHISASTIDEQGKERFITSSPLDILRKRLKLNGMGMYFNCEENAWDPGVSWKDLEPAQWDDWFSPTAKPFESETSRSLNQLDYILHPVEGTAIYIRRGANVKRSEDDPMSDFQLSLENIALGLSKQQYHSYSLLLAQFSLYSARLPHMGYRPHQGPIDKKSARYWWRYAILAVKQQLQTRRLSWTQIMRYLAMRRKYVSLYASHLKRLRGYEGHDEASVLEKGKNDILPEEIQRMDEELPEVTIVMFRRLAYAEFQRYVKRVEDRNKKTAESVAPKNNSGGWLSWLTGGAKVEELDRRSSFDSYLKSEREVGEQSAELNAEEYSKLLEWISEQEDELKLGIETPYSLISRFRVNIDAVSAVIVDKREIGGRITGIEEVVILRGAIHGVFVGVAMYPTTVKIKTSVSAMNVDSEEGVFIETGQIKEVEEEDSKEHNEGKSSKMDDVGGGHALDLHVIQKPQDNSADLVLNASLTPSYVYYNATTIQKVTEFFIPPQELQLEDFESLGAAATSTLEQARQAATAYAIAALSNKPKLMMKFILDAPKISIPVKDSRGNVTVAVDLGRLQIESDNDSSIGVSIEESNLFEYIKVSGSNVSAYLVDDIFSWKLRKDSESHSEFSEPVLIPLMDRCGWEINVQLARIQKPNFPRLRLKATIPCLHFHLSPGRVSRFIRVINGSIPRIDSENSSSLETSKVFDTDSEDKKPCWIQNADKQGFLQLFSWNNFSHTTATWKPRYGVLHQGRIFLFDFVSSNAMISETISLSSDVNFVDIQPSQICGYENVLAIVPSKYSMSGFEQVFEDSSVFIVRFETADELSKWQNSMMSAKSFQPSAFGMSTGEDSFQYFIQSLSDEGHSLAANVDNDGEHSNLSSSTVWVHFEANLNELAIFASGREPKLWWPPYENRSVDSEELPSTMNKASAQDEVLLEERVIAHIDDEVALVILRTAGSSLELKYGDYGMDLGMSLNSFQIQDQLMGNKNPQKCFLATSRVLGPEAWQVGDDVFFDTQLSRGSRDFSSFDMEVSSSGDISSSQIAQLDSNEQELVEISLSLRNHGLPAYNGVDMSLGIKLNNLYFYCNRPTVAALMTMGVDLGVAASLALSEKDEGNSSEDENKTSKKISEMKYSLSGWTEELRAAATKENGKAKFLSNLEENFKFHSIYNYGEASKTTSDWFQSLHGKQKRFKFSLSLQQLTAILNYEDSENGALAKASVDDLNFTLNLNYDGSMAIESDLGNIEIIDLTLPDNNIHRNACSLRPGGDQSLMVVSFAFDPGSGQHALVPSGIPFYTLQAKLSEMKVTILKRFLEENLLYLQTMMSMRLDPLPWTSGSGHVERGHDDTNFDDTNTSKLTSEKEKPSEINDTSDQEISDPFALIMEIEMNAPIIEVPCSSHSPDAFEVDLGNLNISSSIMQVESVHAKTLVLLEIAELVFSGVLCTAVQGGVRSSLIRNPEEGWHLTWKRALDSSNRGSEPFFDVSLKVPYIKAVVSDEEYMLLLNVITSNLNETPVLSEGVKWIEEQHRKQVEGIQISSHPNAVAESTSATSELSQEVFSTAQDQVSGRQESNTINSSNLSPLLAQRIYWRVAISIDSIELELRQFSDEMQGTSSLALLSMSKLFASYKTTDSGSNQLDTSLPYIEVQDCRAHVPLEQSLAISSGHKASFLMLTLKSEVETKSQIVDIILQKPSIVAEPSFLMEVTQFFLPGVSLTSSPTLPFNSYDVHVDGNHYHATEDLYLSPCARLLADHSQMAILEYYGHGHCIVMPSIEDLDHMLPLIIVGDGITLRLHDVTIVNSDSFAACLKLGSGSKLVADYSDGVKSINSSDIKAGLLPSAELNLNEIQEKTATDHQRQKPQTEADLDWTRFQVNLNVISLGLHFVKLENAIENAAKLSRSNSQSSTLGIESHRQPGINKIPSSSSAHILSAKMDLRSCYESVGSKQFGRISIDGLHVDSWVFKDVQKTIKGSKKDSFSYRENMNQFGSSDSVVLHPCRIDVSLDMDTNSDGEIAKADLNLVTSAMGLMLAPRTLELVLALASQSLQPFNLPDIDSPVYGTSEYELVCSFDQLRNHQLVESSLFSTVTSGTTGVSVWRPLMPNGYGIAGHVATPSNSTPNFEVLVIALNSGIVKNPSSFKLISNIDGFNIWRPEAPSNYKCVGDLVKPEDEGTPTFGEIVCIHQDVLVEANFGSFLPLNASLYCSENGKADDLSLELLCIENSFGTFKTLISGNAFEESADELRTPLGVTPSSLIAFGAAKVITKQLTNANDRNIDGRESSELKLIYNRKKMFEIFKEQSRQKQQEKVQQILTPKVVDFQRIWSDGGTFTNGIGLTAWRPVAPPGYSPLGDCLVCGFDPPVSTLVVLDTTGSWGTLTSGTVRDSSIIDGRSHSSKVETMPLLRPPRAFELVWNDGNPRVEFRASFWRPIPYPGYVSLGCVAGIGENPPKHAVKCIRADAVDRAAHSRSSTPLWYVRRIDQTLPPLSVWLADERLHTFVVQPNDTMRPPEEVWQLKMPQDELRSHGSISYKHDINLVAKFGDLKMMLMDTFNIPMLKFQTASIEAGFRGANQYVIQGYLGLVPSFSAFNRHLRLWEPVIEPTNIIVKLDMNLRSSMQSGVEPGIHVIIKSSAEMLYTTLAMNHICMFLAAMRHWRQMRWHNENEEEIFMSEESLLHFNHTKDLNAIETHVINHLGMDAVMEVDYGTKLESSKLRAGELNQINRPLVKIKHQDSSFQLCNETFPRDLIMLDVEKITGDESMIDKTLICYVYLVEEDLCKSETRENVIENDLLPKLKPHTRPVFTKKTDKGQSISYEASWLERIVIPIPECSKDLNICFEIFDWDAMGGQGDPFGRISYSIPYSELHKKPLIEDLLIKDETLAKEMDVQSKKTIHFKYSIQRRWQIQNSNHSRKHIQKRHVTGGLGSDNVVGSRALSLENWPDKWAVIPIFGKQRSSSILEKSVSDYQDKSFSLASLVIGNHQVIMESGFKNGCWMELLRAPCQVVNRTKFIIEAGIIVIKDDENIFKKSWQNNKTYKVVTWSYDKEHSRKFHIFVVGRAKPGETISLPLGWNLPSCRLVIRPMFMSTIKSLERAENRPEYPMEGSSIAEQFETTYHDEKVASNHGWSWKGASSNFEIGINLGSLDENVSSELLRCDYLDHSFGNVDDAFLSNSSDGDPNQHYEQVLNSTLWFSLTTQVSDIGMGSRGQTDHDWQIIISPSLTLVNCLPFPGSFMVWERPSEKQDELVGRATERALSGGEVAVYTADVCRPISVTFYPDGYEWMESGPVLLSSGIWKHESFVDRFRIGRPGSSLSTEIFIERSLQPIGWRILSSNSSSMNKLNTTVDEKADYFSELLSMGVPALISFTAPLWIINSSNVVIDAAVVPLRSKSSSKTSLKQHTFKRSMRDLTQNSGMSSDPMQIKTVWTSYTPISGDDYNSILQLGQRSIAPSSMELFSYPKASQRDPYNVSESLPRSKGRERFGVRLRVAGSGWTMPLALDVDPSQNHGDSSNNNSSTNLDNTAQSNQPLRIEAECPASGSVFGIVARIELDSMSSSQVLRLEPEIIVSNRTNAPMQLLRCISESKSISRSFTSNSNYQDGKSSAVMPENSAVINVTSLLSNSANKVPVICPDVLSGVSGKSLDTISELYDKKRLWYNSRKSVVAASISQLSSNSAEKHLSIGSLVDLPTGASSIPMVWPLEAYSSSNAICIRCAENLEDTTLRNIPFWSRPIEASNMVDDEICIVAPVIADTGNSTSSLSSEKLGLRGFALVRISVLARGPGMIHVVMESAAADPPFLLENRTMVQLHFRQAHMEAAAFHELSAFSGNGYCWEFCSTGSNPTEIELVEKPTSINDSSRFYVLEPSGGYDSSTTRRNLLLPINGQWKYCTVYVGYYETVASGMGGIVPIGGELGGGTLGRGGVDRVLQVAPGKDKLFLAGLKGKMAPPPDLFVSLEIPGLEISLVDDKPQEVGLVTVNNISVEFFMGTTPVGSHRSFRFKLGRVQLDNQLPWIRYPVLLGPSKKSRGLLPMIAFSMVQLEGRRGRSFYPFVSVRISEEVQLALSEPIIWRLMEIFAQITESIHELSSLSSSSHQVIADSPLRIRLLTIPDVDLCVSFQGDPLDRPRHKVGAIISRIMDLANFQGASITVHGLEWSEIRSMRSMFNEELRQSVQSEILGVSLSLLRNFGVIGGATRVLGMLSEGIARLTGDESANLYKRERQGSSQASHSEITDLGDGLLEGAGAFGNSVMRGFRGLIEKPLSGAKSSGVEGAVKGVAKGLVGVVSNPVSGMLDAMSATAEGFGATFTKDINDIVVLQRQRLPRLCSSDLNLQPILRDGSARQATLEQLGQTLLWNSIRRFSKRPAKLSENSHSSTNGKDSENRIDRNTLEGYVEHFVLPNDYVCILTNQRIIYLFCNGFANLEAAVEVGHTNIAPQHVPEGNIQWSVRYEDVLALELKWASKDSNHPDGLIVHRYALSHNEDLPMALLLPCFQGTPQASQIKLIIGVVIKRTFQESAHADQEWAERHRVKKSMPKDTSVEDLPFRMPCVGYEHKWNTNPSRSPVIHFWRPIPPPGYNPIGDVATLDPEEPPQPVACFRNDLTLRPLVDQTKGIDNYSEERNPATSPPSEFSLVWRHNGSRKVTVWMPIPPRGYYAMGAVIMGNINVPSSDDYLCIREDLTSPTRVFDSPIWSYDPETFGIGFTGEVSFASLQNQNMALRPQRWKVSLWPVDSGTRTFMAIRGKHRPPDGVARTLKDMEDGSNKASI